MTVRSKHNPWNLTDKEVQAMNLVCESGSGKVAGMEMGLSLQATYTRIRSAKARMGARTLTMAVLMFDRWAREGANPVAAGERL